MNILITTSSYYPAINGVQKVTQYQAEGLAKSGHEVTVITSDMHGTAANEEWINRVHIFRINAYNKNMFHCGNRKGFQELVKNCSVSADVMINICFESFSADWVYPLLNSIKCKKILSVHGMHKVSIKNRYTWKDCIRLVKWNICCKKDWSRIMEYDCAIHLHEQDESVSYFRKKGYLNNEILYNAVDPAFFKISNIVKENIVINVSSFHNNKNQKRCMKIFWESNLTNYKLVLIGPSKNSYFDELICYRSVLEKRYGPRKVEILYNISRKNTIEFIKKAKIYFLSSYNEHFPISIIEAMATGASYLSTDVGIVKYLPGGIVCKSDTDLAYSLKLLSTEWEKYGIEGLKFAKNNFDLDTQIKKLEGIVNSIVYPYKSPVQN